MEYDPKKLEERRLFERFAIQFPAKYKNTTNQFKKAISLCDASAQGVKFLTDSPLALNDEILLEIDLPDGKNPVSLDGKVVWVQNEGNHDWSIGLKCNKISLMRMSRLYQYIAPPPLN